MYICIYIEWNIGTSDWGKAAPTKVYGDERICSWVEVSETLPSGSIYMYTYIHIHIYIHTLCTMVTSDCGNAAPTNVYGEDKICSWVEVSETLPSGSTSRLHDGDDLTASPGEASITPPLRRRAER